MFLIRMYATHTKFRNKAFWQNQVKVQFTSEELVIRVSEAVNTDADTARDARGNVQIRLSLF